MTTTMNINFPNFRTIHIVQLLGLPPDATPHECGTVEDAWSMDVKAVQRRRSRREVKQAYTISGTTQAGQRRTHQPCGEPEPVGTVDA